jgi:TetR/AcrR family transcriptional regulator
MTATIKTKGRPSDPAKQAQQKEKLLVAAEQLLAEKPYDKITLRELARCSDVNSAMISYYFNNKEGLFIAVLDKISASLFMNMQAVMLAENPIKAFIEHMLAMLNDNSSFAHLMHQELANQDSQLSTLFIERFPKKMALVLPPLVKKVTGITDDKKAKYVAFSLISMIILPFINKSIRQDAWQISDQEMQDPYLAEHIYQQFIYGCLPANSKDQ